MGLRYWIALGVAAGIILLGALFAVQTKRSILADFRQQLRKEKAAGTLPPEMQHLDPDTATMEGFGFELSEGTVARITIADIIQGLWFALIPLVVFGCVGVAALSYKLWKPNPPLSSD